MGKRSKYSSINTMVLTLCVIITSNAHSEDGKISTFTLEPKDTEHTNIPAYDGKYKLIEEYTANHLKQGYFKAGLDLEYGITDHLLFSADLVSNLMGIPSLQTRFNIWDKNNHSVSLGIKGSYLELNKLAQWAPAHLYFDKLEAKVIRPSISWSHKHSERLILHTFWTVGFGKVKAELSETGRRRIWEAKHPDGDYESRNTGTDEELNPNDESDPDNSDENNQNLEKRSEETSNITRRTLELQSLFGLSTDRFQIVGEFIRKDGNKILFSTRIERMAMEELRANSIIMTIAQQWIMDHFQFRLGIGFQYLSIHGFDLDGEKVEETGTNPIPEFSFYWRF